MESVDIVKAYYAALDSADMQQVDQYLSENYQLVDFAQRAIDSGCDGIALNLIDATAFNHVDLIVMMSHGRSGLGRLVMGSVAESVLRGTTTPILLLRVNGAPVEAPAGTAAATVASISCST